jgi:hypothetical protein
MSPSRAFFVALGLLACLALCADAKKPSPPPKPPKPPPPPVCKLPASFPANVSYACSDRREPATTTRPQPTRRVTPLGGRTRGACYLGPTPARPLATAPLPPSRPPCCHSRPPC